jgi:photosystem II stability/assembly factor-like uncharacterized protein
VVITLPPAPAPGDTVSVTGQSANNWKLAQNAGQSILTSNVQGNVAPGVSWTPRLDPRIWHWLSSSAAGDVLVAGEAGNGNLDTSVDGGITWTAANVPTGIWISIDMTPGAERIFAVQYGGNMYMSSDRGASWTQVTSSAVNLSGQLYESISVSRDGQRIVAAIQNGPLAVSSNGGQSWTVGAIGSPAVPLTGWWRATDSSADGMVVVAADQNGPVYRSIDGGLTWTQLNVSVGGAPIGDRWYRLAMSDDGNTIAMAGNSVGGPAAGTGIYVSHDSGATWSRPFALVADYSAVAMSPDGRIIGVTVSNPNPDESPDTVVRASGRVLRSTDGGASFSPLTMPGTDTDWRAIAMSSDGNKLAAATGFYGGVPGQLYTSLGNRTSFGTLGSITGAQNFSITVQYLGNGQFSVPSSAGGAFTIQ